MKITVFTDIHGRSDLARYPVDEIRESDLVILAGDITHFGGYEEAKEIVTGIKRLCKTILAVPGNCDLPGVGEYLDESGTNLDGKVFRYDNVMFLGIGGSLPCPGQTPNEITEEEIEKILNSFVNQFESHMPLILVAHQPPFHTRNDQVKPGVNVGSRSIRQFIETHQPLLCFTGHIHEGVGVDKIGRTQIVNPGPLFTGAYVSAELDQQVDRLDIKNIKSQV